MVVEVRGDRSGDACRDPLQGLPLVGDQCEVIGRRPGLWRPPEAPWTRVDHAATVLQTPQHVHTLARHRLELLEIQTEGEIGVETRGRQSRHLIGVEQPADVVDRTVAAFLAIYAPASRPEAAT